MVANLVKDASQSLLSKANLELLSLDLRSNEGVFVDVRDSFLVVVVFFEPTHDPNLGSFLSLQKPISRVVLIVGGEQRHGVLPKLKHCEHDH